MPEQPNINPVPEVSICIPAYKAEKYLEATLRSVGSQTFPDWELIITEDGTRDRTENIVREFAQTVTQPVIYNRHDVNRGLPATRNTGIVTARGRWVAFLDSDDLWTQEHLEKLVEKGNSPGSNCDAVYAGSVLYDDATWAELETRAPTAADLSNLPVALYSGRLSIMPSSVMIKREAFSRFGLISAEYPQCNDTEYWMRILSMGGVLCYSGVNSCIYRQHPGAMSRRAVEILTDSARLCEQYSHWQAIPRLMRRARPASLYRWAARTLLPSDPQGALELARRALRHQPFSARNLALWAKASFKQRSHAHRAA